MKPSPSKPIAVVGAVLCTCFHTLAAQSPQEPLATFASKTVPIEHKQKDDTNASPRERGRILVKLNPIASEYQVFGDIGTSPGADADGEGVDYRSFFPAKAPTDSAKDALSLGYSFNYNDQSGVGKGGYDARFSKTIGSENKWAIAGQLKSSASDRLIEHYESVWQQNKEDDTYYLDRPRFSFDKILTENLVASLQVGFKPSENHNLYAKTYYQDYVDNSYRNRIELQFAGANIVEGSETIAEDKNITEASFTGVKTRRYFGDTDNWRTRIHHTLGGTYTGSEWTIDYSIYAQKWDLQTLWHNWNFQDSNLELAYSIRDPYFPEITESGGTNLQDVSLAAFSNLRIHDTLTRDRDLASRVDAERSIQIGDAEIWIQTGFLHRGKERETSEDRKVYLPTGGDNFSLDQVAYSGAGSPLLSGMYLIPPGLDAAKSRAFIESHPEYFVNNDFREKAEAAPQSYSAKESVTGAYLLGTREFKKWSFELGGRLERTQTETRGTVVIPEAVDDPNEGELLEIVQDPSSGSNLIIKDLYSENTYTNFIPSVEASYAPSNEVTWKAAWFQLLMRPQYYNIVDYRRISIPTQTISEGNPSLSPTEINKLRLSWNKTNRKLGTLSIEAYLIDIQSFFYGSVSEEPILEDGTPVVYRVSRVENGDSASIKGLEIQWLKTAKDFVFFDSATASLAYTLSDSEAKVPSRPFDILRAPERSDHLMKLGFSGNIGKLTAGVDLSYQSEALDDLGSSYSQDVYREDVIQLDVKFRYSIDERTSLSVSASNLTDHPERSYEGSPLRVTGNQYSSWFGSFDLTRSF